MYFPVNYSFPDKRNYVCISELKVEKDKTISFDHKQNVDKTEKSELKLTYVN